MLTNQQQHEICGIVGVGCPRATAAASVGVSLDDIAAAAKSDRAFGERLRRAEATVEVVHMQAVREAAKDPKHWRASVWWLEHHAPLGDENKTAAPPEPEMPERPADDDLLAWGREFLPNHFTQPPSAMHRWLAEQFEFMRLARGVKLNVVGPRGGAKSTLGTLAYVLRAACEAWEPYVWIVSDTRTQAQLHLDNVKAELLGNEKLAEKYPDACGRGQRWQALAIELPNGVAIEAFGTGQRIRGRKRNADRPTLIVCDDLQNDSHMTSASQREASHQWFHGTLLKAGTSDTNFLNLATALHRDALAMQLQTTPGWRSQIFRAIEAWPIREDLWQEWEKLYTDTNDPDATEYARMFYDEHRDEMNRGAELLWPEVEDLYTLMAMRVESGRTAFEREKQGSPVDPESCEWPESYFEDHVWFDEWPDNLSSARWRSTRARGPTRSAATTQRL